MRHHQLDFMGQFKQQTFNKTVEHRVNQRGQLEVPSLILDFNSSHLDPGNNEDVNVGLLGGDNDGHRVAGKVGEDGFERSSRMLINGTIKGLLRNGRVHSQESKGFG